MLAITSFAALGLVGAACGGDSPTEVQVDAADFTFSFDAEDFTPGTNEITLENGGAEAHHLQMIALADGRTVEELLAGLAPGQPFPDFATFVGGVGVVEPGDSATIVTSLQAGTHAFLCFVETADGVPHFAQGMAIQLDIAGDTNEADAPDAELSVSGSDYSFGGPLTAEAGELTIAFSNIGQEPHEMNLLRLAEGLSPEAALAALTAEGPPPEGPPPFAAAGGTNAWSPGGGGTAVLDLEAGQYLMICFVPNAEGVPHALLGMVTPLTVE